MAAFRVPGRVDGPGFVALKFTCVDTVEGGSIDDRVGGAIGDERRYDPIVGDIYPYARLLRRSGVIRARNSCVPESCYDVGTDKPGGSDDGGVHL